MEDVTGRDTQMTEMNNPSFACYLFACHEVKGEEEELEIEKKTKVLFFGKKNFVKFHKKRLNLS